MGTRLSFRPRPVDVYKQLSIVRDLDELDSQDGLKDGSVQEVQVEKQEPEQAVKAEGQPKPAKHIPTPEVRFVQSYPRDYLPVFRTPSTYIRRKGGVGWQEAELVDYDLDKDDEEWLAEFNRDAFKLPPEKFEKLLWKLELACARALERSLAVAGAAPSERWSAAAVACFDYLRKNDALSTLQKCIGGRSSTLLAVYEYWCAKRRKWGKPLLRCLQAPTSASDTNSYNVFRPREKVNRPQTRRRRENSMECFEKLRTMKENLLSAMEMTKLTLWREKKKAKIRRVDTELQVLQMKLHMLPQPMHDEIEVKSLEKLQALMYSSSQCDNREMQLKPGLVKRKREEFEEINFDLVAQLPPPPAPLELDMVFTQRLPLANVTSNWLRPSSLDQLVCRARIGRGGRLVIDRCNPYTYELLSIEELEDEQQMQPWAALLDPNILPDFVDKSSIPQLRPPPQTTTDIQNPLHRPDGDPLAPSRSPSPLRTSAKLATKEGHVGYVSKKPAVARTTSIVSSHVKRGPGRPPKVKNAHSNLQPGDGDGLPSLIALDTP